MKGMRWCFTVALTPALLLWALATVSDARSTAEPSTGVAVARALEQLGAVPLHFVGECRGDHDSTRFAARSVGYAVTVESHGARIALQRPGAGVAAGAVRHLQLQFLGAAQREQGSASDPLPGTLNRFGAAATSPRCVGLRAHQRIRFAEIYPGVAVVYYGNGRVLEFDLELAAGADPSAIRIGFDGADRVSVDADGNVQVVAGHESVIVHRPVAYQQRAGTREAVRTRFARLADSVVGIELEGYDPALALVIDPVVTYATYLGGSKTEFGLAIKADANGNVYIAGYTTSPDFPLASAYDSTAGAADVEAFVTKLAASGKTLVYSTYLGGSGIDRALGVAVDAAGNAYVTGTTTGSFPVTANAYRTTGTGNDSFVAKLGPLGNTLIYSTYIPGVEARSIAVDAAGSAYVAGRATSAFVATPGAYQQSPGGAFVLKLNATGTSATYATYLGQGGNESANAIALDIAGSAYVAGSTDSTAFPAVNAFQPVRGGGRDGFVAKLDASGSALLYSTYLGGARDDVVNAIAVDAGGSAYVAGETYSTDFPSVRAYLAQKPGSRLTNSVLGSAFFARLDAGGGLVYGSFLGGEICTLTCTSPSAQTPGDAAYGIAVDDQGHAYVTGIARSYTFPLLNSIKPAKTSDAQDSAFLTKVSSSGGALLYSTLLRTGTSEPASSASPFPPGAATGVSTDASGAAYVTGDAETSSSFSAVNAFQTTNGGGQGAIAVKLAAAVGTITLASSAVAVIAGESVTLTATIAGASLSGSMLFYDGARALGTAAISGSKAVLTTTLPVGIHRISALHQVNGKELDSNVLDLVVDNALVCN